MNLKEIKKQKHFKYLIEIEALIKTAFPNNPPIQQENSDLWVNLVFSPDSRHILQVGIMRNNDLPHIRIDKAIAMGDLKNLNVKFFPIFLGLP